MATFGYTSIGGNNVTFNAPGSLGMGHSARVYSPSSGYNRITKLWIYGSGTSIQLAVYTISSELPVNRLAAGASITLTGVDQWNSVSVNQTMINGNTYGIAEGATINAKVFYDVLTGNQRSHTPTDLPATWSSDNVTASAYSMYAEYETVHEYFL